MTMKLSDQQATNVFELHQVSYRYSDKTVLGKIGLSIPEGKITGILGRNGSGKTTLLKLLSGIHAPHGGEVLFRQRPIHAYTRKELAKQIAFLEQNHTTTLPFTVREVVEMGRYPWLKPFAPLGEKDNEVVHNALSCFQLIGREKQIVENMSGGEQQLVSLARAMAQEPRILILDEPTTFLDIGHQEKVMEYLYGWHKEQKTTIIMVVHDLNLSSQYCDHLAVLDQGKLVKEGAGKEVLREDLITAIYKTNMMMIKHPVSGAPQFLPTYIDLDERTS